MSSWRRFEGTPPQTLQRFTHRVRPLGDVPHSASLENFSETAFIHLALLASKFGREVSANLGLLTCAVDRISVSTATAPYAGAVLRAASSLYVVQVAPARICLKPELNMQVLAT